MSGPEKVAKTERLLNLISLLLRSRKPVPFAEIAGQVIGYNDEARLDSIEKRFDRDKAELRNMGIPVDYVDTGDAETAGYIIPKDKFFLGKIELDSEDGILLSMAARAAKLSNTSPLMREAFASAMRKLSIDLPALEMPFEPAPIMQVSSGNAKASANLQTICAAVYAKKTIAFEYAAAQDGAESERRVVDPYGLGISRGDWYFVGNCRTRRAVRMFKLARVTGQVGMTGASDSLNEFEIPANFKITDHLRREAWDFGEKDPVRVRVRVPSELAPQLAQSASVRWDIEKSDVPDSHVVASTEVRGVERLLDWIFSLGPNVRVIDPPEAVELAKKRIAALKSRYADALREVKK